MSVNATLKRGAGPALALALLLCAADASAQMYKWTDAKGVVHYSDQPPPANARKAETKSFGGGSDQPALPYALAEAVRNHPVVLYTTANCTACDDGRTLLRQRGIPFTEKTVNSNDDQQKLKEAGGDGQLPLLLVGSSKRIGFEAAGWNEALAEAAYPAERRLPAGYTYPPATPAAAPRPLARDAITVTPAEAAPPRAPAPKPASSAPPIQF